MFRGAFRLFRFAGVQVFLHWSWFILAYFEVRSFAHRYWNPIWAVGEFLALFAIVLAHGGGSLPFVMARMDRAYAVRRECRTATPKPPSAYLKRLYFDTITHGAAALRFLIDAAGPARVLLGTDHPYDMADPTGVRRLRRLRLSPAAAAAICHRNARRLFRV